MKELGYISFVTVNLWGYLANWGVFLVPEGQGSRKKGEIYLEFENGVV
jgi:hypothetical protein